MMATSDNLSNANGQAQHFPFMSLHPELRQIVYQEVFSHRAIVLYEELDPPGLYMCARRYWHFRLKDSRDPIHDVIALLQTSKQIFSEAQSLLRKYTPSHLTLSKELRRQPECLYEKELTDIGLPFNHITHLNLNVKILGTNPRYPRDCPGPPNSTHFHLTNCRIVDDPFGSDEGPPPDPQRDPNLKELWRLSECFRLFPALREIHIYDVLKHHLSSPAPACPCPIAGTANCTCGRCQCDCITYPALPSSPTASIAQVKEELHDAFLFRFRNALPLVDQDPCAYAFRRYSDYLAMLEPLVYGAQIFLHEEIALMNPIDEGRSIHKGVWRARYQLNPPESTPRPAEIPNEPAELPRSCRFRKEKEQQRRREEGVISLPSIDYGLMDDDPRLRKIPELLNGMELVAFECGLELEIVDETGFDRVVETFEMEGYRKEVEARYATFWQWG